MQEQNILTAAAITDLMVMVAGKTTPAVMTHISKGKWHMTKVSLLYACSYSVHLEIPQKDRHHPVNIRIDQPVGISFKHDYSKYVFDSTVTGFEPGVNIDSGGIIVIASPERVDRLQKRNFYRVSVPTGLNIRAIFWHRGYIDNTKRVPDENQWQGTLVDLSAGGLQIAIDPSQRPNFSQGQLIGMQFTPMPYEKPILLECQVRHIAPTADGKMLSLGIQIIGLEATAEGRDTLHRLCDTVKLYYDLNAKTGLNQPIDALVEAD